VIYESRLELARLLFADFDSSVQRIVAQPFRLRALVAGDERHHIPDYLLLTTAGPVVVDVKPRRRLADPKAAFTLAWSKTAVESRGWTYEIWSEPSPTELDNVRFLAGYRRDWLFDQAVLAELRVLDWREVALCDAERELSSRSAALVRPHILHLLWCGELITDLTRRLGASSILRKVR
jgi:hypothetical protein